MKLFFIFNFILNTIMSQIDYSDPTPNQLNKTSHYKGLMYNMKALYESDPVSIEKIKSYDQFLSFDLIYFYQTSQYNRIKTELTNDLSNYYKDKDVDLFGVKYFVNCYFSDNKDIKENSPSNDKVCMYGGVTEHKGNRTKKFGYTILVSVFIDNRNSLSFTLSTNKDHITAQELDYKVRNRLIKDGRLYEFESSRFETGYIKFIENGKAGFWYDLMPPANFSQSKYLMIYKDNKTLLSSKTAIEVHLTKKK